MASILSFGSAWPERVVNNQELAPMVGRTPEWIRDVSGIEERRWAEEGLTVVDLAVRAAEDCLQRTDCRAGDLGMLLVASGSSQRQFPGPACEVAFRLGLSETPALDLPMASAGSLFGMALAAQWRFGPVLVIGAEIMSRVVLREPIDPAVAVLFGDGAGACLIGEGKGKARIAGWKLATDGAYAADLRLENKSPLTMNGRSVIMQASRKLPRVINQLLSEHATPPESVRTFLMHQANQNLMDRVADSLSVDRTRFFSNIRRYGNTSSASVLLAAAEWDQARGFRPSEPVCFAAFGAGFHWGALLAFGKKQMPELIEKATIVAAAGQPPKTIREYVGRVNSATPGVSVAHMTSPPGWVEPGQTPEFDEYTLVLSGMLQVEHHEGVLNVAAGQAVIVRSGEWVRYSTPAGADYVAVCLPAFWLDGAHRDPGP